MSKRGMVPRPMNEELGSSLVIEVPQVDLGPRPNPVANPRPVYTIVVEADSDEDAAMWLHDHLDPVLTKVRLVCESAFLPHRIVRLDTDFREDTYSQRAFEASLNHAMNDPISNVVWWSKT